MNRLVFVLISSSAMACGASRSPSPPPPPPAPIAVTPPPMFADSPVTALAVEMCDLALDVVHERPIRFHRLKFGEIERHVSHSMGTPEAPCVAVGFDLSVVLKSPVNGVHDMQTAFVLTRRRLTAFAHGSAATPDASVVSSLNVFPEIDGIYASFVDAVTTGHAGVFQPSEIECADMGIAESEKCRREMSQPMITNEIAQALAASNAKNRTVMLSTVYVFARAADSLVRMRLDFDLAPDLVFWAEPMRD